MYGFLARRVGTDRGRHAATAFLLAPLLFSAAASAGESLQRGFYYHDPGNISLTDARSGAVCSEDGTPKEVCEKAHKIVITGEETCDYPPDKRYPCTRFGYEFGYEGAAPGSTLDCVVKRTDPMGRRSSNDYTHRLDDTTGHIFFDSFRTYGPVDERLIFAEVHECAYRGELLTTIEFLIYYEPGVGGGAGGGEAEQLFTEVPNACASPFLTEGEARRLLNADSVKASAANEHVAVLSSQCMYSGRGVVGRQTGYVFKFMLSDMFDVDKLDRQQLQFNATFAVGGAQLTEVREDVGDMTFVFADDDRSILLVITGIKGRKDFAGRPQEFMANYYLERPDMSHEQRTDVLLEEARRHLEYWRE